jgi:hypothetical protein
MLIRTGNRHDFDQLIELLTAFKGESPHEIHEGRDVPHLTNILTRCLHGGIILVAEDNKKIVGTIVAMIIPDIWFPKIHRLIELAWYVYPEYRNTTAGARLFTEYQRHAESLLSVKRIKNYSLSLLRQSPPINLEKRGFRLEEQTYIAGE